MVGDRSHHPRIRWGRWALIGAASVFLLLLADGLLAVRAVTSELRFARDELERAAGRLEDGDVAGARASFERALEAAEAASGATRRPGAQLAGLLPGIGDDVDAVAVLTGATILASTAGERLADAASAAGWDGTSIPGSEPGRIDVEVIAAAEPALSEAAALLAEAEALVEPLEPDGKLASIGEAVTSADEVLGERSRQVARAADVVALLPGLLGADGERTYAIVMMTLSDPRGSGGYPGSYGVLRANDGALSLEELAPTGGLGEMPRVDAPQDVVRRYERFGGLTHFISSTYSPDWPTSAQIWMEMWEASGREPLDGVIGADSVWMSYVLAAIGPVETPAWPETITAENVSRITDSETMLTLDKAESDAWQADIATSLWQAMVTRPLDAQGIGSAVSRATAERHLQIYSTDPQQQSLLDGLDASGRIQMPENPLMVSWSGFVGSRTGFFAEKSIDYRATVYEEGTTHVTITLTLANHSPTQPESILLGAESDNFDVGEYAAAASVYLPTEARGIRSRVNGGRSLVELFEREFDRRVVLTVVVAKAGQTTTAEISYRMPSDGAFELGIVPQPELRGTPVSVAITFPPGILGAGSVDGLEIDGDMARYVGRPSTPLMLSVTPGPRQPDPSS